MLRAITAISLAFLAAACSSEPSEPPADSDPNNGMTVYLTGYSYWDNTPPGSAIIARPVIHDYAGGTGTYEDPITLAVGHSINGFSHPIDYPVGSRWYFPSLKKYAIVEDLCGDGMSPQDGPCHIGKNGRPWVDIYVDGSTGTSEQADQCMYSITGFKTAIYEPREGLEVIEGDIFSTNCARFSQ